MKAWLPWIILSVFVFIWGTPQFKTFLDGIWIAKLPVAGLNNLVMKVPPVVVERMRKRRCSISTCSRLRARAS